MEIAHPGSNKVNVKLTCRTEKQILIVGAVPEQLSAEGFILRI